jgi:prepilin-type N-terminal cleavage/methylation domain-containing protein
MREKGFTLVELLAVISIVLVLSTVAVGAGWKVYEASSLAVSANNIRQLSAGGINYLAEHNGVYWPYQQNDPANGIGITYWFGFESAASMGRAQGEKEFDPSKGPLGGYIPKGIRPDPSFALSGVAFKPKYRNGYIGVGYNVVIGGGFLSSAKPATLNYWQLSDPSKVVVFGTTAQVNDFQTPASSAKPMLEEFYSIDPGNGLQSKYPSVHFRNNGKAMVSFASGNAGFLNMDESTRDMRMPKANVGRFAPVGDTTYLK